MSIKRFWRILSLPGLLTLLLVGCAGPVNTAQSSRQTVDDFIVAVRNDDLSLLKVLLQRGVDPNLTDNQGQPALILAAREQAWNSFDALLTSRRLKLDIPNRAGETALMYLALLGQTERAKRLIDLGAAVNRPGWTPLHYAATNGHVPLVELLLDAHAYIDANSEDGTTPLMMAARGNYLDTVNLLLRQGADPTLKTRRGMSAADFARMKGHGELAQALDARIALPSNPSSQHKDIPAIASSVGVEQAAAQLENNADAVEVESSTENLPEQPAAAMPVSLNDGLIEENGVGETDKEEIKGELRDEVASSPSIPNDLFNDPNQAVSEELTKPQNLQLLVPAAVVRDAVIPDAVVPDAVIPLAITPVDALMTSTPVNSKMDLDNVTVESLTTRPDEHIEEHPLSAD